MKPKRLWPTWDECLAAIRDGDGAGVRVAVLDTGVDISHQALSSLRLGGSWEVRPEGDGMRVAAVNAGDVAGHGTAVAALIHALAPAAEILSVRVLDAGLRQDRHRAIREGAGFALRSGAQILNCSFGVVGSAFRMPDYLEWVDAAFRQGRIVVGACGNQSPEIAEWPSHLATVVGVTAAALEPETIRWRSDCAVEIEAAGVDAEVPVPGGGMRRVTGSSFATARVSGLLARLVACFPGLTVEFAREAMRHYGEPTQDPFR